MHQLLTSYFPIFVCREYMNSLTRQRAGEGHQEEPREEAQMWEQYNPDGMGDPTHGMMGNFSNE